ncbi:hypothetical protein cypCar_00000191 [Cyprinus carpio]|nr:hypothetical protein cypCar_00000191 [Cyprinus carpio]
MQVTVERVEPSAGPQFQHGFPDRLFRCGFNKSLLDSERTLQWKRTRRAQDNMSPVRERDDSLKKKLLNEHDKSSVPDPFTRSVSRVPNSGLRILGNQLEPPKQEGVQYICRRESSDRTSSFSTPTCLDKREDHSE